jgi:precorrin-2 dehydrogenase / sirohydrochlorin ferrochelatase
MPFYPVNLNIQNRFCLIVGGGEVASRKIEPVLACGARVRVISPAACTRIRELAIAGRIEWQQRGYRPGDLQGAFLVFAATDNVDVQQQVVSEAQERGILMNSADNPEACTFQVPATVRQGDLLLTISTGGGSPALAAWIRKRLAREFAPEYGLLVRLFATIRRAVAGDGALPLARPLLYEKILETDVLSCIGNKDWPALQERLAGILPPTIDVAGLVADIALTESHETNKKGRALRDD